MHRPAQAQSAVAEGQKLAFDRSKGNCLTCHEIKGGDLPAHRTALADIKAKYPNRADLVAIVTDETKRNPLTVMPPFGRNHILTEKEIDAVVDSCKRCDPAALKENCMTRSDNRIFGPRRLILKGAARSRWSASASRFGLTPAFAAANDKYPDAPSR